MASRSTFLMMTLSCTTALRCRNTDFSFLNFTSGQRSQAFPLYVRSQLIDFEPGENNYSLTLQARDTNRPELTATAVVPVIHPQVLSTMIYSMDRVTSLLSVPVTSMKSTKSIPRSETSTKHLLKPLS
ncbi:uncharacterized protein LOC127833561 [Dreissena polymorpha]|uniref:uncharacterized protein LOC127833561 n=1 Tax=Dreissena polymorpha TaxID=45954 RepID=UPI002263E44B|nr:uncharacterized protein LOC127833561 [Dreissena polymorpha]